MSVDAYNAAVMGTAFCKTWKNDIRFVIHSQNLNPGHGGKANGDSDFHFYTLCSFVSVRTAPTRADLNSKQC